MLPAGWRSSDSSSEPDKVVGSRASPLGGPSRQLPHPGGGGKPKLVQSVEQFLLSFAYPSGRIVSSNSYSSSGWRPRSVYSGTGTSLSSLPSSSSSNLNNKRPKSARFSSIIEEPIAPITTTNSRRNSSLSSKGISKTYEHAPLRASTLPSMSNPIVSSSNINTPIKSVPYLLTPGIFGKCVLGSGGCDVDDDDDTRGDDAYMDPEATASLTIGEIILLGALDFDHTHPSIGPGNGRAWIENVKDVVMIGAEGSSNLDSGSDKVGVGKAEGQQVVVAMNSLPTPPQSLSSNNSAESADEEREEEVITTPPSLSAHSSSSSDIENLDHARMPSRARNRKRVSFMNGGADKVFVECPTTKSTSQSATPTSQPTTIRNSTPSTGFEPSKRKSSSSSLSTATPTLATPTIQVLNSKQPLAVQVPPLVIHRDRARSPRGSEDSYDLGLGHGVPVPSMMVSKKPGTRSASGSSVIPLRGCEVRNGYGPGGIRSPLVETGGKGMEKNGFMDVLRKMGLLKSVGLGLKL